jgi:hypothetical protein
VDASGVAQATGCSTCVGHYRILDYRQKPKKVGMAYLDIKLFLPNGVVLNSRTDADGTFLLKIETFNSHKRAINDSYHVNLKDHYYSYISHDKKLEQTFFAIGIVPDDYY